MIVWYTRHARKQRLPLVRGCEATSLSTNGRVKEKALCFERQNRTKVRWDSLVCYLDAATLVRGRAQCQDLVLGRDEVAVLVVVILVIVVNDFYGLTEFAIGAVGHVHGRGLERDHHGAGGRGRLRHGHGRVAGVVDRRLVVDHVV